jgi:hypothetical protein
MELRILLEAGKRKDLLYYSAVGGPNGINSFIFYKKKGKKKRWVNISIWMEL